MQIFIRTFSGRTITLQVQPFYLVSQVKAMIQEKEGMPLHNQRLIFSGKDMQDYRTLRIYNVQKETTLELSSRLLGGGGRFGPRPLDQQSKCTSRNGHRGPSAKHIEQRKIKEFRRRKQEKQRNAAKQKKREAANKQKQEEEEAKKREIREKLNAEAEEYVRSNMRVTGRAFNREVNKIYRKLIGDAKKQNKLQEQQQAGKTRVNSCHAPPTRNCGKKYKAYKHGQVVRSGNAVSKHLTEKGQALLQSSKAKAGR